jgi:hypothetical protein
MSTTVTLREIAHARSGDKGDRSNICVFVYDPANYETVAAQLTPEYLKKMFGSLFRGDIVRYGLPQLHGFNFVLDQALEGGVNRSLNLDGHGKSWSSLILSLTIEIS